MKRLLLVAGCFLTTIATAAMVTIFDDDNEEFTFTLRDQLVIEADGDVRLFITENLDTGPGGGNNPPVAQNDSATTPENTAVTLNVTLNDSDPDGDLDLSTLSIQTQPSDGSAQALTGGNVRYTPDTDFVGTDSFVYRIGDMMGNFDTATVTVQVNEVITPPNCSATPPQGSYTRNTSHTTFDHCEFGVVDQLGLASNQYYALRMNMNACPENQGRIFYGPDAGSGQPLRVTISACPGVYDDSAPPIPGDQFLASCSRPAIAENTIVWSLDGDQFSCRINPGQQVYLNIVYGDNANPPTPSCDSSTCNFILQPLQ